MTRLASRLCLVLLPCIIIIIGLMQLSEREGRLLAYVSLPFAVSALGDLHIMDMDSRLTMPVMSVVIAAWSPRWTDDGRYLTYQAWNGDKYYYDTQTGARQIIIEGDTYPDTLQRVIDWFVYFEQVRSPDDRYQIIEVSDGDFNLIDTQDGITCALALDNNIYTDPRWSPDGESLAYVTWDPRFSTRELYLLHAPTCTLSQITFGSQNVSRSVNWSPDGSRLLFERDDDLFTVSRDGNTVTTLTQNTYVDLVGSWSERGIVFASNRDGDFDLYVMDADGTNTRRLFDTPDDEVIPLWQP